MGGIKQNLYSPPNVQILSQILLLSKNRLEQGITMERGTKRMNIGELLLAKLM